MEYRSYDVDESPIAHQNRGTDTELQVLVTGFGSIQGNMKNGTTRTELEAFPEGSRDYLTPRWNAILEHNTGETSSLGRRYLALGNS